MKAKFSLLVFLLLFLFTINCIGSLRRDRIPAPPVNGGCLVGGVMYTSYVQTLITGLAGTAPNETVTGYRYQYSMTGSRQNCYLNRANFVGPDPNAAGNTPIADIGCGLTANYGSNTISTSTFTPIQCPIDTYIGIFVGVIGVIGFFSIRNHLVIAARYN